MPIYTYRDMSGAACPYICIETCQVLCFLYGSIIWPDYGLLLELRTPTQATHSWGCVYTGGLHNCLILLSYHLELYRLLLVTQCFNNIRELLTTLETLKGVHHKTALAIILNWLPCGFSLMNTTTLHLSNLKASFPSPCSASHRFQFG